MGTMKNRIIAGAIIVILSIFGFALGASFSICSSISNNVSASTASIGQFPNDTMLGEQAPTNLTQQDIDYVFERARIFMEQNPIAEELELENYMRNLMIQLSKDKENSSSTESSDYSGLIKTPQMLVLIFMHPVLAWRADADAALAKTKTKEFYLCGGTTWNYNNSDAFRHGYWNALMVRSIGYNMAQAFATANEPQPYGIIEDMDLVNNAIGRANGLTYIDMDKDQLAHQIVINVSLGHYYKMVGGTEEGTYLVPTCTEFLRHIPPIAPNQNILDPSLYEMGDCNNNPGWTWSQAKSYNSFPGARVRTSQLIPITGGQVFTVKPWIGYQMSIAFRDSNTVSILDSYWRSTATVFVAPMNAVSISIVFRRGNDATITVPEIQSLSFRLELHNRNVLNPTQYQMGDCVNTVGQTWAWAMGQNHAPTNSRVRASQLIPITAGNSYAVFAPHGYQIALAFRDVNTVSVRDSYWRSTRATFVAPLNSVSISVTFRKDNDAAISVGEIQNLHFEIREVCDNLIHPSLFAMGDCTRQLGFTFAQATASTDFPNARAHMSVLVPVTAGQQYVLYAPYGYGMAIAFRNASTVSIKDSFWQDWATSVFTAPENAVYMSVTFRKNNNQTFALSEIQNQHFIVAHKTW
jgi:hypothetical protein